MECSVSIDKLGRKCSKANSYMYKDRVNILPLAMVDGLLGIAHCGLESIALNTFINVNIEMKKLRFHTPGPDGKTSAVKSMLVRKTGFAQHY